MANETLVKVDGTFAVEFDGKKLNEVADLVHGRFTKALGVFKKNVKLEDIFDITTGATPEGTPVKHYQLRSMSKIVGGIAEKEIPGDNDNKDIKKARSDRRKELINMAKFNRLGDYVEAAVRAMGYGSQYKSSTKTGEVTIGFQPQTVFYKPEYRKFEATEEARQLANKINRDRRARLQDPANADKLAALKLLAEDNLIDINVEIEEVLEGKSTPEVTE